MYLTKTQRLILYSLGLFYRSLNQPLEEKHLKLRTSKIAFIEALLQSRIVAKQERALYKNLEQLEKNKLISYEQRMIRFTDKGVQILEKIDTEVSQFKNIELFFQHSTKIKRRLQTRLVE